MRGQAKSELNRVGLKRKKVREFWRKWGSGMIFQFETLILNICSKEGSLGLKNKYHVDVGESVWDIYTYMQIGMYKDGEGVSRVIWGWRIFKWN